MEFAKFRLGDINPVKYNPRKDLTPADDEYQHIKNSIENFGYIDPIIVNVHDGWNNIVGGHQRYKILVELGHTEADCVVVDFDEAEEKACNAALNKAQGDWDTEALNDLLKELDEMGVDMSQYGFETSLVDEEGEVQEDEYDPEETLTAPAKAQQGDIYELGDHRLMCGDSTDPADVEELMDGNLAKLIVTDPPYNVALGMDETPEEAKKRNRRTDGLTVANDKMEDEDFYAFLLSAFKNAIEAAEPGCGIYVWHADTEGLNFRKAFVEAGFDLKQCLIWVKNALVMGRQDYQWRHEPCLYGWKPGAAHYFTPERTHDTVIDDTDRPDIKKMKKEELLEFTENLLENLESIQQSVIYCDKPSKSGEHPTMKPLKLIGQLVRNSSQEGWNVLDLFGGSGSTLMACEALGRNCYMMEYDPKYVDVIVDRWEKATGREARLIHRRAKA